MRPALILAEYARPRCLSQVTDSPTLGEMRQRLEEKRQEARLTLEELSRKKPQQKRHVRTWHRLNGAPTLSGTHRLQRLQSTSPQI